MSICTPYYDNQYNWFRVSGLQSTANAIKDPFTFYYVQDNDWSSTHNYDYWNKNFTTSVGLVNTPTLKTIYDPAISGFVEPTTSSFTNFTSDGSNTTNFSQYNVNGAFSQGWHFYTFGWKTGSVIFFEALGYRDTYSGRATGTGAIVCVGATGVYWSAGASSSMLGLGLVFDTIGMYPQGANKRSYGYPNKSVSE